MKIQTHNFLVDDIYQLSLKYIESRKGKEEKKNPTNPTADLTSSYKINGWDSQKAA